MDNQITVSRLLNMLDELSMNGFGDMPVFLGENYPLLEDSISVNPSAVSYTHLTLPTT